MKVSVASEWFAQYSKNLNQRTWVGEDSQESYEIKVSKSRIEARKLMMRLHPEIERPKWYVLYVHHKDRNPLNNDISNLEIIKREDHIKLHLSKNKNLPSMEKRKQKIKRKELGTTKFERLYGLRLKEISIKLGKSMGACYLLHKKGILKGDLEWHLSQSET